MASRAKNSVKRGVNAGPSPPLDASVRSDSVYAYIRMITAEGELGGALPLRYTRCTIGRKDADLTIKNMSVSREHAVLDVAENGTLYLTALTMNSSTKINEVQLAKTHTRYPLNEGDVMTIGPKKFRIEYGEAVLPSFSVTNIVSSENGIENVTAEPSYSGKRGSSSNKKGLSNKNENGLSDDSASASAKKGRPKAAAPRKSTDSQRAPLAEVNTGQTNNQLDADRSDNNTNENQNKKEVSKKSQKTSTVPASVTKQTSPGATNVSSASSSSSNSLPPLPPPSRSTKKVLRVAVVRDDASPLPSSHTALTLSPDQLRALAPVPGPINSLRSLAGPLSPMRPNKLDFDSDGVADVSNVDVVEEMKEGSMVDPVIHSIIETSADNGGNHTVEDEGDEAIAEIQEAENKRVKEMLNSDVNSLEVAQIILGQTSQVCSLIADAAAGLAVEEDLVDSHGNSADDVSNEDGAEEERVGEDIPIEPTGDNNQENEERVSAMVESNNMDDAGQSEEEIVEAGEEKPKDDDDDELNESGVVGVNLDDSMVAVDAIVGRDAVVNAVVRIVTTPSHKLTPAQRVTQRTLIERLSNAPLLLPSLQTPSSVRKQTQSSTSTVRPQGKAMTPLASEGGMDVDNVVEEEEEGKVTVDDDVVKGSTGEVIINQVEDIDNNNEFNDNKDIHSENGGSDNVDGSNSNSNSNSLDDELRALIAQVAADDSVYIDDNDNNDEGDVAIDGGDSGDKGGNDGENSSSSVADDGEKLETLPSSVKKSGRKSTNKKGRRESERYSLSAMDAINLLAVLNTSTTSAQLPTQEGHQQRQSSTETDSSSSAMKDNDNDNDENKDNNTSMDMSMISVNNDPADTSTRRVSHLQDADVSKWGDLSAISELSQSVPLADRSRVDNKDDEGDDGVNCDEGDVLPFGAFASPAPSIASSVAVAASGKLPVTHSTARSTQASTAMPPSAIRSAGPTSRRPQLTAPASGPVAGTFSTPTTAFAPISSVRVRTLFTSTPALTPRKTPSKTPNATVAKATPSHQTPAKTPGKTPVVKPPIGKTPLKTPLPTATPSKTATKKTGDETTTTTTTTTSTPSTSTTGAVATPSTLTSSKPTVAKATPIKQTPVKGSPAPTSALHQSLGKTPAVRGVVTIASVVGQPSTPRIPTSKTKTPGTLSKTSSRILSTATPQKGMTPLGGKTRGADHTPTVQVKATPYKLTSSTPSNNATNPTLPGSRTIKTPMTESKRLSRVLDPLPVLSRTPGPMRTTPRVSSTLVAFNSSFKPSTLDTTTSTTTPAKPSATTVRRIPQPATERKAKQTPGLSSFDGPNRGSNLSMTVSKPVKTERRFTPLIKQSGNTKTPSKPETTSTTTRTPSKTPSRETTKTTLNQTPVSARQQMMRMSLGLSELRRIQESAKKGTPLNSNTPAKSIMLSTKKPVNLGVSSPVPTDSSNEVQTTNELMNDDVRDQHGKADSGDVKMNNVHSQVVAAMNEGMCDGDGDDHEGDNDSGHDNAMVMKQDMSVVEEEEGERDESLAEEVLKGMVEVGVVDTEQLKDSIFATVIMTHIDSSFTGDAVEVIVQENNDEAVGEEDGEGAEEGEAKGDVAKEEEGHEEGEAEDMEMEMEMNEEELNERVLDDIAQAIEAAKGENEDEDQGRGEDESGKNDNSMDMSIDEAMDDNTENKAEDNANSHPMPTDRLNHSSDMETDADYLGLQGKSADVSNLPPISPGPSRFSTSSRLSLSASRRSIGSARRGTTPSTLKKGEMGLGELEGVEAGVVNEKGDDNSENLVLDGEGEVRYTPRSTRKSTGTPASLRSIKGSSRMSLIKAVGVTDGDNDNDTHSSIEDISKVDHRNQSPSDTGNAGVVPLVSSSSLSSPSSSSSVPSATSKQGSTRKSFRSSTPMTMSTSRRRRGKSSEPNGVMNDDFSNETVSGEKNECIKNIMEEIEEQVVNEGIKGMEEEVKVAEVEVEEKGEKDAHAVEDVMSNNIELNAITATPQPRSRKSRKSTVGGISTPAIETETVSVPSAVKSTRKRGTVRKALEIETDQSSTTTLSTSAPTADTTTTPAPTIDSAEASSSTEDNSTTQQPTKRLRRSVAPQIADSTLSISATPLPARGRGRRSTIITADTSSTPAVIAQTPNSRNSKVDNSLTDTVLRRSTRKRMTNVDQ